MNAYYDYEEDPDGMVESETTSYAELSVRDIGAADHEEEKGVFKHADLKADDMYEEEEELDCSWLLPLRASTAPAWPLTEMEEFKWSADFLLIESTMMLS